MQDEEAKLIKRFTELSTRAADRGITVYSEFLTLSEQALLGRLRLDSSYTLVGGYEGAERRLAVFGAESDPENAPISCLLIEPSAPKYAEALGHRDYLGSLLGLGIRREVLGDLLVDGQRCYLLCLNSIAGFIKEQLAAVRRTEVTVSDAEALPDTASQPEEKTVVAASERLDALVSAVYDLSRAEGQRLIGQGRVFINGAETLSAARAPKAGDIVSVRGSGRFMFCGAAGETRKGRLRITVKVY